LGTIFASERGGRRGVDSLPRDRHPSRRGDQRILFFGLPHLSGLFSQGAIMTRMLALAAAVLAASAGATRAQDLAAGENSFKKCLPCHSVGDDAKNKVGPVLNGLEGRKSGTVEGYSYSEANKNSGITWSDETFKEYIRDPRAKIPGTKMVFAGIKNDKEVNDLWAYLKSFGPDGHKK
jgi:cytochrome c